jgi:hypothetical protein
MTDDMAGLQHQLREFAAERNWERYHTPRNLSALIASEAGELLALFRWDVAGIDLIEASRKKISANADRYPAGLETPATA